jgi:type II secretory pathway pseudopilin PulG
MGYLVALWILILICELAVWAWPVTVALFGLALVALLISLIGHRGRVLRRQAAEVEVARRNAASQLAYERRQAESRMWEEYGRQMRGEG